MENKDTTIQIKTNVLQRLRKYEVHPRQSTNEIIEKILDEYEKKKKS